ncbi:MAG TPA: DUF6433 family protein [Methanosarcina sp.]|nr:DUF6433 family protein [Methanosarcina sp.]
MAPLNPVKKYLSEMLQEANDSSDPVSVLQKYRQSEVRLTSILGYAINPKFAIHTQIPAGNPPFKESNLPLGKAAMDVLYLHNKLYIMFNSELKQFKKEEFFLKWVESMHPTDAKILIAVKDQNLESLYPKLTKDVIRQSLGWSKEDYQKLF